MKPTYDYLNRAALSGALQDATEFVNTVNHANGWHDDERDFAADIALLHSEVSEAFEGYRKGDDANVAEELADVFIRLLDTCSRRGVNLATEFDKKMKRNAERGYKHGGKRV